MKRKLLSVFLSLAMVLTMMPVFAMANSITVGPSEGGAAAGGEPSSAEGVAQIGEQSYGTLESAISEAKNEETIKLLANVSVTSEIDFTDKAITLDLNGKTIDGKVPNSYSVIEAKGESASLTIKDTSSEANGKLISNNYGISAAEGGKLIIESGTIESNYAAMAGNNTAGDMNFEVNGGILTSKLSEAIYMPGQVQLTVNAGEINGGISARMGQITVNGGTINGMTSNQSADKMEEYYNYSGSAWIGDAIYIWGGTYTSNNSLGNKTNVKINGGIINGNAHRAIAIYDIGTNYAQNVTVEISGDTVVSGDVVIDKAYGPHKYEVNASIEIKGGTFSYDVTEYCAENYVTEKNGDNTYTVKPLDDVAVAQIGNKKYKSLADAYADLTRGKGSAPTEPTTIKLLKDCAGGGIGGDKTDDYMNYIIDFNGHTYTVGAPAVGSTGTVSQGIRVLQTSTAKFMNGTLKAANYKDLAQVVHTYGNVTFEDFTVDATEDSYAWAAVEPDAGTLTILGNSSILAYNNNYGLYAAFWHVDSYNGTTVNIDTTGKITGKLAYEFDEDYTDSNKALENKGYVNIKNGYFDVSKIEEIWTDVSDKVDRSKGGISIEGGYFNSDPTDYLVEGKVAESADIKGYAYKVVDKTEGTIPAESDVTSVPVKTIENASDDTKEAAKEVNGVAVDQLSTNVIDAATKDLANKNKLEVKDDTTVADSNAKVLDSLKELTKDSALTADKIALVYQSYIDVTVKEAVKSGDTEESKKFTELTVDLTPMYRVVATKSDNVTNDEDIIIEGEASEGKTANAVVVQSAKKLDLKDTSYEVSLALPNGFAANDDKLSIKHVKDNGTVEYYTGTVSATETPTIVSEQETSAQGNTTVTFTTNGFSPFTVYAESAASIKETQTLYPTLQAAVDAVKGGQTIKVTKDREIASVSGDKSFTIENPNNLTVTLNAASGYNLTDKGNGEYTVSSRHSSSGSSATTYTVTVGSVSNGTVTSSHKSAASGTTVTLTVKPADGYAVEAVTAKDAKGNAVKVTEKDGKYTFAMPASNVTVSASFVKKGEQPAAKLFDDVAQGAYYYDAVKWAVDKGVTNGKTSNLFGSDDPCTRAQIVTFLWRAAGSPAASASVSFTDVKDSDYYAKAVAWAVEKGITNGTGDGKFSSDDTCTRAQCAAFLYRAAGSPEVTDAAAFSDVAADAYYAKAVAWAEKNGITNGLGNGKFGSDNSCTRAQIITFLYRTYQGK